MALTPGTRLGAYEILALLGSGGMGEVYRARDTRLDRVVAIKVLPDSVAGNPDRRQRLEREARAISSLNHPHICTLYDVGHQDGLDYLVMEFLEGQTLAERLTKGALPLNHALQCAIQLADALDVAHRHGIVHRDLKPANVFISRSGSSGMPITKLLDFGIAKAIALSPAALSVSATLTDQGTLLGTVQYMAPEQLEGRAADVRSDLFAFGVVLYEMVTGRRAFSGESQASVIAAVLDSDPSPLSASQSLAPPALEHLVKTCLAKNPDARWQTAGDVKRQLEWIATSDLPAAQVTTVAQRGRSGVHVPWTAAVVAAIVVLIAAGALTWYAARRPFGQPTPAHVIRTTIATSGEAAFVPGGARHLAITADATRVVYVGKGNQLLVRRLDRLDSTPLFTGVSPLNFVCVSPNGDSVGFAEGTTLRKIDIGGGPVMTIVESIANRGAAWAPDDTIIFANSDLTAGLQRVSATGGPATVLTKPDHEHGEQDHLWPEMLPGGHAVLFTITATAGGLDAAQVAVFDLVKSSYKVLVQGGRHAHYVPGVGSPIHEGHLVYVKGEALVAVPFDLDRLEPHGATVTVLPGLSTGPTGSARFDVASDGTLVYEDKAVRTTATTLVWVDRQGQEEALSATLDSRPYAQPRISPNGRQVAVYIDDQEQDIWLFDVALRMLRRLTLGPLQEFFPVWTKDGSRVAFFRSGAGLFWQRADFTGQAEPMGANGLPSDTTRDGKVLFSQDARDLMVIAPDTRLIEPLVKTPSAERNGVVSPDGQWLAYESNSSLRFEIAVTSYPDVKAAGPWPISTAGGTRPLWSPSGQELFFVAPDGAIMAVRVTSRGGAWSASSPKKIVDGKYDTGGAVSPRNFDISPDGKRFLVVKELPVNQADAPQIQFVQNWTAD